MIRSYLIMELLFHLPDACLTRGFFLHKIAANKHIAPDHLLQICKQIGPVLDKQVPSGLPGVHSLLGTGRHSVLRTAKGGVASTIKPYDLSGMHRFFLLTIIPRCDTDCGRSRWKSSTFAALHRGRPPERPLSCRDAPNLGMCHCCFYQVHLFIVK